MPTKLSRDAFRKLIAEDLEWLRQQPRTLEREHIELVLSQAEKFHYDLPVLLQQVIDEDDKARHPALNDDTFDKVCEWIEELGGPHGS